MNVRNLNAFNALELQFLESSGGRNSLQIVLVVPASATDGGDMVYLARARAPSCLVALSDFFVGMQRLVVQSTLEVRCNESAWLKRRFNDTLNICCRPVRVGQG